MKFPFPFRNRLKEPDPKAEEELNRTIIAEGGVEKSDVLAMILGAYSVILPAVLIAFGAIVLLIWLLFF